MANKLPQIFAGSKICIICEGDEEYEYLEKLSSLDIRAEQISARNYSPGSPKKIIRKCGRGLNVCLLMMR